MKIAIDKEQATQISKQFLLKHNFGELISLRKMNEGFLNSLYEINNEFILKICGDVVLESHFKNGLELIHHFQGKLPVPVVIEKDFTKKLLPSIFYFYYKIPGVPLSSTWHTIDNLTREDYIKQIISYLKIINSSDVSPILKKPRQNWALIRKNQIQTIIAQIEKNDFLDKQMISKIKSYYEANWLILKESLIVPVYWDLHLGNFLVSDSQITGILDLESIEYLSIDYALNIIYQMVQYPHLFLPKKYEHFSLISDYKFVIQWFKKHYPEMFAFPSIDIRIKLYALEYDLNLLLTYPSSESLKHRLKQILE